MKLKERDMVVRGVKQLLDEAFEPYEKRIKELEDFIKKEAENVKVLIKFQTEEDRMDNEGFLIRCKQILESE